MKNNWSTKAIVGGTIIALIGLGGILYWKMSGNKNSKNNHSVTPKTSKKENKAKNKTVTKTKKAQKVNYKFSKNAFDTADQLVKLVCLTLLKENTFTSPVEFLEKLIRYCCLNAKDASWSLVFPKSEEELMEKLKSLNLYEKFLTALEEKYKDLE